MPTDVLCLNVRSSQSSYTILSIVFENAVSKANFYDK
jgi:hypothetical protein